MYKFLNYLRHSYGFLQMWFLHIFVVTDYFNFCHGFFFFFTRLQDELLWSLLWTWVGLYNISKLFFIVFGVTTIDDPTSFFTTYFYNASIKNIDSTKMFGGRRVLGARAVVKVGLRYINQTRPDEGPAQIIPSVSFGPLPMHMLLGLLDEFGPLPSRRPILYMA